MSEYSFYQIDATGVSEPDLDSGRTIVNTSPIRRAVDSKISFFGSMNVGGRMESDYTRTKLDFESKDDRSDWEYITGAELDAEVELNPYVLGSTIKRVRDDQFFRMGMSNKDGKSIDLPKFDVGDTREVTGDLVTGKNWPSEGWRSFGGKYDFPYVGGGIH